MIINNIKRIEQDPNRAEVLNEAIDSLLKIYNNLGQDEKNAYAMEHNTSVFLRILDVLTWNEIGYTHETIDHAVENDDVVESALILEAYPIGSSLPRISVYSAEYVDGDEYTSVVISLDSFSFIYSLAEIDSLLEADN